MTVTGDPDGVSTPARLGEMLVQSLARACVVDVVEDADGITAEVLHERHALGLVSRQRHLRAAGTAPVVSATCAVGQLPALWETLAKIVDSAELAEPAREARG